MAQCKSRNENGEQCRAKALKNKKYCFMHDPTSARKRAEARKLGGKRRRVDHAGDSAGLPTKVRSIAEVMMILDYTLTEVVPMENSIARGRLLIALSDAYIKALEIGELESRLEAIEKALFEEDGK